ncbi:MAG: hypothetical protein VR74_13620 [Hyphomonas sp. BRH_c22]|uniref:GMC family oxidoreductase n=1 Tax=Hyphomonas sp. BRH_c22 TaxID=1629710 RepID=UPI0005F1E849|nr:GMC family oxidoreductase [Hyphomonas sp. BRH_c22]KJS36274.1 MAG: hypothetical protein VR74_13620 [Hyphomonas sp. BRH_c22]
MSVTPEFDVIVVGSGAGGAMSALTLTRAGHRVLMLEAGRHYDPVAETPMFNRDIDAPLGNLPTEDRHPRFFDPIIGGAEIEGEPYVCADGTQYDWVRTRMLGGRTNAWWGFAPRFGPYDFKSRSRDGLGVDWPVTYNDIAPYYDRTEEMVGMFGSSEGFENEPGSPPGILQPPPPLRAFEYFVQAGFASLGIPSKVAPTAILTQPLEDRQACFYSTHCRRGCSIGAKFQTTTSFIPMALRTGNLTLRTDAMVIRVNTDADGRATGVTYGDNKTGERSDVTARAVVLAASTFETARIMMNSKSGSHPDGLGSRSGQLGRNIANTVNYLVDAQFPLLEDRPRYNEDGVSVPHMYIPWWGYKDQKEGKLEFTRGYHFQVYGGMSEVPGVTTGPHIVNPELGYGAQLKAAARRRYGSRIRFEMFGEMIPNAQAYMDIDQSVLDKWGSPVVRFHWGISDSERAMARHGMETAHKVIDRMGGVILPQDEAIGDKTTGAGGLHETGSARMGDSPDNSVVNNVSQCWDVDNLVLADASVFASHPHKNPTLTIMALSLRASEALAQRIAVQKSQGGVQ